MITPAQRHRARVLAAKEAAAQPMEQTRKDASQYELMLIKLREDKQRMRSMESIKARADVKAQLLPEYLPYVQGVISAGNGQQDDVLTTVMVWAIDAAVWETAVQIAEYAVQHKLSMPDEYSRSVAGVVTEQISEAAIKALADNQSFDLNILRSLETLAEKADMQDEIRAKLHKALGYGLRETDPESALVHLKTALSYNEKSGVKTDIKKLESQLNEKAKA